MVFAMVAGALLTLAASPAPSPAATNTPVSDPCGSILSEVGRPTVTTSACVLKPGHLVDENGWQNTIATGVGGGATTSFTQTFIHWGTYWIPNLEFTVSPPSWNRSTAGGATLEGTSDMNVGAKYELGYGAKDVLAVHGQVSVPSGDVGFTGGGMQYTGAFDWIYTLNSEYGLAGTLAFNALTGFDANNNVRHFSSFVPSFNFSAALPSNAQAFAEYTYFSSVGLGSLSRDLMLFGYVRDFTPNTQFDVEYGYERDSHYVGVGLSFMH